MGFSIIPVLCVHVVMARQMWNVRGCFLLGLDCQIQALANKAVNLRENCGAQTIALTKTVLVTN